MTTLVWDNIGDRTYETGLDKGVLYLPDGSAVPWNGLVDVIEKSDKESTAVYFDGMKISELVSLGAFLGTLKAITYPDEFVELDGFGKIVPGLFVGEQRPQLFHLCYRTKIGNDLNEDLGYKIHVLYNVTAVPNDKTYSTITESPNITVFEWEITALPEEAAGFRPTAHVVIDSRLIDPVQLAEYEDILYGTEFMTSSIIPLIDFTSGLYFGYKWKIIDNGDGTWMAINPTNDLIDIDPVDPDLWTLNDVNADYLSDDIYQISDSYI